MVLPRGSSGNIDVPTIIKAVKERDLTSFFSQISSDPDQDLSALWRYTDKAGNSVFHLLLTRRSRFKFNQSASRNIQATMLVHLLKKSGSSNAVNVVNDNGDTPLLRAVKFGYDRAVAVLVQNNANITRLDARRKSALEIAADLPRNHIYTALLTQSTSENKAGKVENSYSCEQLLAAQAVRNKNYDRKRLQMGIIGGLVSIACPVGAVLLFYEWPLLELFFTMLIPGAGPLLGAIAAVVAGGLLFWSVYHKADRKFGSYAKEMLDVNTKLDMVKRLDAELKKVDQQLLKFSKNREDLEEKRSAIIHKIKQLCPHPIKTENEDVIPEHCLESSDAATTGDGIGAFLTSTAGFLCAFSGMLGILGGASSYLPTITALTIVAAGVPIAGWCALAISLAVGIVGAMVYQAKYDNSLAECGEARKKLEDKKSCLYQQAQAYKDQGSLTTNLSNDSVATTFLVAIPEETRKSEKPMPTGGFAGLMARLGLHRTKVDPPDHRTMLQEGNGIEIRY